MIGARRRDRRARTSSRAEDRERFLPWVADEGVRSFAHVPLEPRAAALRRAVGRPPRRGRARRRASSRCSSRSARPAAAAIANALEFQHERRIARALTRGFIPDAPPELEGFALGLVYEPVGHEVSGGDIFGVWRLPGGALAVLVGDVSGKGIEVAAVSAMVRFFIEARTWDSDCPATVLAQTNAILRSRLAERRRARDGVPRDHRRRRAALRERRPRPAARRRRRAGAAARAADDRAAARHRGRRRRSSARELRVRRRRRCCSPAPTGSSRARRDGELFGQERVAALVAEHAARSTPQALVELAYARRESRGRRSSPTTSRSSRCARGERRSSCATSRRRAPASRALLERSTWRSCASASPRGRRSPGARFFAPQDASTDAGRRAGSSRYEDGRPSAAAGCARRRRASARSSALFVVARARAAAATAGALLRELERRCRPRHPARPHAGLQVTRRGARLRPRGSTRPSPTVVVEIARSMRSPASLVESY